MLPRVAATVLAVAGLVAGSAGCSPDRDPTERPGITPPVMRGRPVVVDTCDLLPVDRASAIAGQPLSVVGIRVEPPRLETVRCDLGRRFAEPLVSVSLSTDPIALEVFEAAYGDEVGGDPVAVEGIKAPTILRKEGDQRTIRSFVHGAVVSVQTSDSLRGPSLGRQGLVALARLALSRLPRNPVVRETGTIDRCDSVPDGVVALALGRPPTLRQEFSSEGSVQCSWGGQPGAVVITVSDDPDEVRRARRLASEIEQLEVTGVAPTDQVRAWSSRDVAGDLVVLADDRVFSLEVTPAAGFYDAGIATSPPELALARAAVRRLR